MTTHSESSTHNLNLFVKVDVDIASTVNMALTAAKARYQELSKARPDEHLWRKRIEEVEYAQKAMGSILTATDVKRLTDES